MAAADPVEVEPEEPTGSARSAVPRGAKRVVSAAESFVGAKRLRVGGASYRDDCSGLVAAIHAKAGVEGLAGGSPDLLALAKERGVFHRRKIPAPGDVAFFRDTFDRNQNGRMDDPVTHVAVVVAVAEGGTITMVHRGSKGVTWLLMNLQEPHERRNAQGEELNDQLRFERSSDPAGTRYLAGELWIGFASFWSMRTGS